MKPMKTMKTMIDWSCCETTGRHDDVKYPYYQHNLLHVDYVPDPFDEFIDKFVHETTDSDNQWINFDEKQIIRDMQLMTKDEMNMLNKNLWKSIRLHHMMEQYCSNVMNSLLHNMIQDDIQSRRFIKTEFWNHIVAMKSHWFK